MHPYRRLSVWRKSHELTLRIYGVVEPIRRRYPSLAQQLVRAAHSIPSNLAEGSGRASGTQFAQFLQIALGSARELDYFLRLATDLGALPPNDHAMLEARTDEVTRMLVVLRRRVISAPRALTTSRAPVKP
jgi:four helix bundle protein